MEICVHEGWLAAVPCWDKRVCLGFWCSRRMIEKGKTDDDGWLSGLPVGRVFVFG